MWAYTVFQTKWSLVFILLWRKTSKRSLTNLYQHITAFTAYSTVRNNIMCKESGSNNNLSLTQTPEHCTYLFWNKVIWWFSERRKASPLCMGHAAKAIVTKSIFNSTFPHLSTHQPVTFPKKQQSVQSGCSVLCRCQPLQRSSQIHYTHPTRIKSVN